MKKTALVTGGTGGIGEAVCRQLASDGYFVIINYFKAAERAESLSREIHGYPMQFDVSDEKEVHSAAAEIADKFGSVNLLVNNAGVSEIELFTHINQDAADKILNINLKGTLNCSRAFLPSMIREKSGGIINISSMWGQCGASCEVDYSASKAGIIGFTKALAKEVGLSGVRVNCVSPGFIMTEMNSRFSDDELNAIREEIPLGSFGKPKHIADAVSFLASDRAEFITGQILGVNGGMVI
ncbi:MAG: 3-oxoacyl-ACP reductase FabG [Ruminococcus sp.]|nr:3-oxoacyl-ACP reductase FabG [Ruminococcus sp.]